MSDILYVVYGLADRFGFDADADFTEVHDSNMSKLCISEEEAKATVTSYEEKFKSGKSPYDSPYYYKVTNAKGEDRWLVKNKSTGKALKSINYTPVDFH